MGSPATTFLSVLTVALELSFIKYFLFNNILYSYDIMSMIASSLQLKDEKIEQLEIDLNISEKVQLAPINLP